MNLGIADQERRTGDVERRERKGRHGKQEQPRQSEVGHPAPIRSGTRAEKLEEQQRSTCDCERFRCEEYQPIHHFAPFALRARAIIASSSSRSSLLSLSDIPRSALAAPAAEPLKNTRTMSLSAEVDAAASETAGL